MSPAVQRPRILVVDDSKAVRRIVSQALAPFDCDIDEATNGFTALFAMERISPHLLLIDVAMPTMDGVEMLTMLKSHDTLRQLPVIMLTSTTDHKIIPQIAALGVEAMLRKPFSPAEVVAAVRTLVPLSPFPRV